MNDELIREIVIHTQNNEERAEIGQRIHRQLVGLQDYIDSNIVLNCDMYPCKVVVSIFKECKYMPPIAIY